MLRFGFGSTFVLLEATAQAHLHEARPVPRDRAHEFMTKDMSEVPASQKREVNATMGKV